MAMSWSDFHQEGISRRCLPVLGLNQSNLYVCADDPHTFSTGEIFHPNLFVQLLSDDFFG